MANFKTIYNNCSYLIEHQMALPIGVTNEKKLTPCIIGSLGEGKSALAILLAKNNNLWLIHIHLADRDPTEVGGWLLPNKTTGKMERYMPDFFPTEEEVKAKGYDGVLLFFDEVFKSPKATQNVVAQIVNENGIGVHKLPHKTFVMLASNRMTDKSNEISPPTHLKGRIAMMELEPSHKDFLEHHRLEQGDQRIDAYLNYRPENHSKFDRDADACANSRNWKRAETVLEIYDQNKDEMFLTTMIISILGKSVGADFLQWLPLWNTCPNVDEMIANGGTCEIPEDDGILYAVLSAMSVKATDNNIVNVCKFLDRLKSQELIAYALKNILTRTPTLRHSKHLRNLLGSQSKLAEILMGLIPK